MYSLKHRPTCFDDVVGNIDIVNAIKNSLNSGIGCRGILLTGGNGIGKTTLGRIICMNLLGVKSEEELHDQFNYFEIDSSLQSGIDSMRDRVRKLHYKPVTGDKMVYFFDECSSISKDAQRALLKAIENEKINYNYFIFSTSGRDKIIPDLIDRLTERRLNPVSKTDILRNLERVCRLEEKNVDKKVLIAIAANCELKIRKSLQILEDFISTPDDEKGDFIEILKKKLNETKNDIITVNDQKFDNSDPRHQVPKEEQQMVMAPMDGAMNCDSGNKVLPETDSDRVAVTIKNNQISNHYLEILEQNALTSDDILNALFPEPRFFISPFIREGAVLMIYAKAGVGKSWFVLLVSAKLTPSFQPAKNVLIFAKTFQGGNHERERIQRVGCKGKVLAAAYRRMEGIWPQSASVLPQ